VKAKPPRVHKQQHEPPCPYCGTVLNGIAATDDYQGLPHSGDFSVCLHCGELLVFTVIGGEIGLRKPKAREVKEARDYPVIQEAMLEFKATKGSA
jgi:hypothetical protein